MKSINKNMIIKIFENDVDWRIVLVVNGPVSIIEENRNSLSAKTIFKFSTTEDWKLVENTLFVTTYLTENIKVDRQNKCITLQKGEDYGYNYSIC